MSTKVALAAIREAVRVAGGQTALANLIGPPVTQRHIWIWLNRDKRCQIEHAPAIEAATDVPVERLAPGVKWLRGSDGTPTGYVVDVAA